MSARARLETALARIAGSGLNAVTETLADAAREAAAAADARAAHLGPLDGCLLGIKDNIAVRGAEWTAGLAGRRDRRAGADATATRRLRAAGAIPLAMLNMHEGALGATTDNPLWGPTANPLDPARTPGGSSGGSAAAVAAGLVDLALGTDTMGSVRIPAAYCGIAGLKPTRGRIGRGGLVYLAPSLDTIGPLAPRVADLTPALAALSGPDPDDPDSLPAQDVPMPDRPRLGIPRQLAEVDCEPEVLAGLARARAAAEAMGCTVTEVDLAGWSPARARRAGLVLVEAEGAVALADLMDVPGALSPGLAAFLAWGRDLPSARLVAALARIRAAAAAAERALAEVDLLLMPTAPQRAFRRNAEPPESQADLTALANLAGLPALALPVPLPGERLPASVQLVGPAFSDTALLTFGAALEARLS